MTLFKEIGNSLLRLALYPVFAKYVSMPGRSYQGTLPALNELQKEIAARSKNIVSVLAEDIGERSIATPDNLQASADYIESQFLALGYEVYRQPFVYRDILMYNLVVELPGSEDSDEILVLGAHYDTVIGCPGADDNGTGIAGLLELARLLKGKNLKRTIRFAAFANEENNGDGPTEMGSYHYARECSEAGDNIVGMISLEMLGCYSEVEGSQKYPFPFNLFYPRKGCFIGFVGNTQSGDFVRDVIGTFRASTKFPSEGVAAPEKFKDIARSDHWAFWQFNYPALMMTDTSNFRYEHLHLATDSVDKVDFDKMARVVAGILNVIMKMANA